MNAAELSEYCRSRGASGRRARGTWPRCPHPAALDRSEGRGARRSPPSGRSHLAPIRHPGRPADRGGAWPDHKTCNSPQVASLPPSRIAPKLADAGVHIASGSGTDWVLHKRAQNRRRGRARKPGRSRPPASRQAKAPCELWSGDITWLPGPVLGKVFSLSLIADICSRKIFGRMVQARERGTRGRPSGTCGPSRGVCQQSADPARRHRQTHEGRHDKGRPGAPRCHPILRSAAVVGQQPRLGDPVSDLHIHVGLADERLRRDRSGPRSGDGVRPRA